VTVGSAPIRLGRAPAEAVEYLEEVLGLSSKELAHVMGTDPRTIDRWRKEESYPQREARSRLAELVSLSQIIAGAFEDRRSAQDWLNPPSRYIGGLRPIEAIRARRVDLAEPAIGALQAGVFI